MTEVERLNVQKTRFFTIMKDAFGEDSERFKSLDILYKDYGDRLIEAPAAGKLHYHNAYSGGYIDHVLHVHDCAMEYSKVLKKMGGWVDFTKSEVVMSALHHDLWKLGMPLGEPYFVIESSDWHRKNQGSIFKHNDKLPFLKVTDGAVFILQKYNVKLTLKEWLAIKLSDGLYEDSNKGYLMNYGVYPIHTDLPYVIHWADHMSTVAERDPLKQEFIESIQNSKED